MEMDEPRFVFDTNVLIRAALNRHSISRRAVDVAQRRGSLLMSEEVTLELVKVLSRRRIAHRLTPEERREFLDELIAVAEVVEPAEQIRECRDPKDDMFLELAVGGNASCLISEDHDLLVLNPFRGILILTPHDFLHSEPA